MTLDEADEILLAHLAIHVILFHPRNISGCLTWMSRMCSENIFWNHRIQEYYCNYDFSLYNDTRTATFMILGGKKYDLKYWLLITEMLSFFKKFYIFNIFDKIIKQIIIENLLTVDRQLNSGTVWKRREDHRASEL